MSKLPSCKNCQHLFTQTESWELSHIWWYECSEREFRPESKFPFKHTKCKFYKEMNK